MTLLRINCGGKIFITYRETIEKLPNCPLKVCILDERFNQGDEIFIDISPRYLKYMLEYFLDEISKFDDILITTGLVKLDLVNEIINNKNFKKIDENIFLNKNNIKSICLVNTPSFEDIESLLRNSKKLISCHGAITHAANSFDIQIIDIIEKHKRSFYAKYTSYLNMYTHIYRENFNYMKNVLLDKLK